MFKDIDIVKCKDVPKEEVSMGTVPEIFAKAFWELNLILFIYTET